MVRLQNLDNNKYLQSNIFGKVWLSDKESKSAQNWLIELVDEDGKWFYLKNEVTDLYLDNPIKSNGKVYANLLYFKNQAQQWTFDGLKIVNRATGLALGADSESRSSATQVTENNKLQLWTHL